MRACTYYSQTVQRSNRVLYFVSVAVAGLCDPDRVSESVMETDLQL